MSTRLPIFDPGHGDRLIARLDSAHGALPLCAVTLRAEIVGTTAGVEVEQAFENPYDEALEVSYVFPLPEMAAVTRCELRVAGREVAARLMERATAREAYAEAIESGHRAALAEQERPGVFTLTLGNLAPRERASVRFGMAYPLPRQDGRHVFRFPLVVAERYVPGEPLEDERVGHGTHFDTTRVPDASRLGPPRLAPGAGRPTLDAEIVLIHGELGIHEVECSMQASEEVPVPGRRIVRLAAGQAMDRDLVVRFRLGGESIRSQLWIQADATGDEGTFQLTIVPPASPIRRRPRDVVLVLDRSGSMDGWKIVAARRAMARMIDALDDADRFAAYAFGSATLASEDLAYDRLHAATAGHRARAAEFLQGISASGGTEMAQPLALAVGLLATADPERDRWIVLVTDGQVANEDELVALVGGAPGVKVFALGIDEAINSSLLARLASASGGRFDLVDTAAELEGALDRLHLSLASPALERVAVAGDAIVERTVVPPGPLHAFPGVPLVVRGRYRRALRRLRVTALASRLPFEIEVDAEPAEVPVLRACWAREQLIALEDRFATHPGARGDFAAQIVEISMRFGVLCRFTAFVAVDDRGPIDRGPIDAVTARHVQQPVEPTLARAPAIPPRSKVGTRRWGLAQDRARNSKTMAGTLRPRFFYMSPGQLQGLQLGPEHEVYVLARLLWDLLTGEPSIHTSDPLVQLMQLRHGELPARSLPHGLSRLERVLRRALDKDPEARPATPGALADELEAVAPAASAEEVGAWIASLGGRDLARQAALYSRMAGVRPPSGGYIAVARWHQGEDATIFFAVRSGAGGPEAIALRRLSGNQLGDPGWVDGFLSEAAIDAPGIACVDDAGSDSAGGVFWAQRFVRGLDLEQVLHALSERGIAAPPAIAVAVVASAARALDRVLSLPTPEGAVVGMLVAELAPSSLRVDLEGRTSWTSLGLAPSPHHTARRRLAVPLTAATGLDLDKWYQVSMPPLVGRSIVVPRTTVAATPRPPRPRRWLWWL